MWSAQIEVPAGNFECKFINGNAWGAEEVVPAACGTDDGVGGFNRLIAWDPSQGSVMAPVCFGACTACVPDTTGDGGGGGGTDPTGVSLTLAVNMEGLNVAPEGVYIAGTWQGWDAGATPMTEVNGSGVWAYTTTHAPGTYLKYKFINGNAWGKTKAFLQRAQTASTDSTLWAPLTKCSTRCVTGPATFVQGLTWRPNVLETSTTTDHTTSLMCLRCCRNLDARRIAPPTSMAMAACRWPTSWIC